MPFGFGREPERGMWCGEGLSSTMDISMDNVCMGVSRVARNQEMLQGASQEQGRVLKASTSFGMFWSLLPFRVHHDPMMIIRIHRCHLVKSEMPFTIQCAKR